MAIRPRGSLVVMNYGGTNYNLYCNEITREFECLDFDRTEFSNKRLREAKNSLGGDPIIIKNVAGIPIQLLYSCGGDTARPLVPDDANIAAIKQRMNIIRWKIKGDINAQNPIDEMDYINQAHEKLIDQFHLYLDIVQNMEISYQDLVARQATTFTYLTSTVLSLSGNALGTFVTPNNLLLTDLDFSPEIEVTQADGTNLMLRSFNATFEQWTNTSRG